MQGEVSAHEAEAKELATPKARKNILRVSLNTAIERNARRKRTVPRAVLERYEQQLTRALAVMAEHVDEEAAAQLLTLNPEERSTVGGAFSVGNIFQRVERNGGWRD